MAKRYSKKIIKPGTYAGEKVTAARIKHWADTHTEMIQAGLLTPAPYFHDKLVVPVRKRPGPEDSNSKNNSGFWDKLYVDKDGYLVGEIVAATDEDADRIGKAVKQCSLAAPSEWEEGGRVWRDCITHIALTNKAKAHTHDEFVPVVSMSEETPFYVFSLEMLATDEQDEEGFEAALHDDSSHEVVDKNTSNPDQKEMDGTSALDSVLKLLAEQGIELTDDTDQFNFFDHLASALTAIQSSEKKQEGEDLTEQPQGSKTQKPSPIAMSHELAEFAADLLSGGKVKDPATNEPFTPDGLEKAFKEKRKTAYVQMSPEDQAMSTFVRSDFKQRAKDALILCVSDMQISPALAKKVGQKLDKNFIIELSEDGTREPSWFDFVIEAFQTIPKNALMNVVRPAPPGQEFTIDFSNDPDIVVEPLPKEQQTSGPGQGYTEMTPEEAEKLAENFTK